MDDAPLPPPPWIYEEPVPLSVSHPNISAFMVAVRADADLAQYENTVAEGLRTYTTTCDRRRPLDRVYTFVKWMLAEDCPFKPFEGHWRAEHAEAFNLAFRRVATQYLRAASLLLTHKHRRV